MFVLLGTAAAAGALVEERENGTLRKFLLYLLIHYQSFWKDALMLYNSYCSMCSPF